VKPAICRSADGRLHHAAAGKQGPTTNFLIVFEIEGHTLCAALIDGTDAPHSADRLG
jgi:hypothetical protein